MRSVTPVRFDPEIREQLDKLADELGKPLDWIIKEAVAQYLAREARKSRRKGWTV